MKRRSRETFSWAIVFSAIAHFIFLAYAPPFQVRDIGFAGDEMTAVDLPPPEIDIPPPPQQIARPATPVISEAKIDENITIAATTFEANPVQALAPPPVTQTKSESVRDAPTFTPMTVKPELLNQLEVVQVLERQYPPLLRDAGISGIVVVWFLIDVHGNVIKTQISQSSTHLAMDEAALKVADVMRFRPAKNRDKIVEVWVEIPITFQTR